MTQAAGGGINLAQILMLIQIAMTLITMAGLAFGSGRVFERLANLQKETSEIKTALFGADGRQGAFVRKSEASLMQQNIALEHEAFDRRLEEFNQRLGAMEARTPQRPPFAAPD